MNYAIEVENLSKKYQLGELERYYTFRDTLADILKAPFRKFLSKNHKSKSSNLTPGSSSLAPNSSSLTPDFIWALKDVSFQVKHGEVLGIIGRNGAGKSTLLKLLSRITAPTEGAIKINGRVGSLLEVGTGFHPELTGRENIFLNGSILGMSRKEINNKFDEIVNFAEIEKFLDTPVKRYSSGMYVRLAFAVAAHLEPEILIVDEVLAVGDASFQKRCLNKMQDESTKGRTVIFVSHNMSAITRLCERTILMDIGHITSDGPSHKVVSNYLQSDVGTKAQRKWTKNSVAPGNDIVCLKAISVRNVDGQISEALDIRFPIEIEIEYYVKKSGNVLVPNLHFYNEDGICVFIAHDCDKNWRRKHRPKGLYKSAVLIPGNFLAEGTIIVGAAISTHDPLIVHFFERDAIAFQVIDSIDGDSARGDYAGHMPGIVRPLLEWSTQIYRS